MIAFTGKLKNFSEIGVVSVVWNNGQLFGNAAAISKIESVAKIAGPYIGGQAIPERIENRLSHPGTAAMLIADVFLPEVIVKTDKVIKYVPCPENAVC